MSQLQINRVARSAALKRYYTLLNKKERNAYKRLEHIEQIERALYSYAGFYATAPRTATNSVDWAKMEREQPLSYNCFCDLMQELPKKQESYNNYMKKNNLTEKHIRYLYNKSNQRGYGGNY